MKGKVKFISHVGYCFLVVEDEDRDVFSHRANMVDESEFDELVVGSVVEFNMENTTKGLAGKEAKLIKKS